MQMSSIPTGMTCAGVHRAVVEHLLHEDGPASEKRILDIPCGNADLMWSLRSFFPRAEVRGCDLAKPPTLEDKDFAHVDASRPFQVFPERKFDCILSVSGVMEFDNTLQFFETCHAHQNDDGRLIVTNDNVAAMRDRILYLFLGKTRRFQMFVDTDASTWKVIPLYNLLRILNMAGFHVRQLQYVSAGWKDWLLLPLALMVFPVQSLYIQLTRNPTPLAQKRRMYPFKSLLCSHYMVFCDKVA
jgi:cyclopropane fatty-acyl-phospholipid synthase-like methyltransferase